MPDLQYQHVAGAKRLIPQQWRKHKEFDDIHKLDGVAVITVQLRYNGWITELQDTSKQNDMSQVRSACCCQHSPHCSCALVPYVLLLISNNASSAACIHMLLLDAPLAFLPHACSRLIDASVSYISCIACLQGPEFAFL